MHDIDKRHILLCVAGMTPQIITETLYVLTQKRCERVDEIRVITTIDGRNKILKSLLDEDDGKFVKFCHDFDIEHDSIKFDETTIALLRTPDGLTLADIREPKENEFAGNQICQIVEALTKDPNTRIHASAAGGRKTMSIYLTAAMQLFGRPQDTLSHVLVNEDFESTQLEPEFYYPPPTPRTLVNKRTGKEISTADAKIYLADIPFIRLRGVLENWLQKGGPDYGDYVLQAQEELRLIETANDLQIIRPKRIIILAGQPITLPKRQFFFYVLFAEMRQQKRGLKKDGFITPGEITIDDVSKVFRHITGIDESEPPENFDSVTGYDFMEKIVKWVKEDFVAPDFQQDFLEVKAKIKNKIGKHFTNESLCERFAIASEGEKPETRYGLKIAPDRIFIE